MRRPRRRGRGRPGRPGARYSRAPRRLSRTVAYLSCPEDVLAPVFVRCVRDRTARGLRSGPMPRARNTAPGGLAPCSGTRAQVPVLRYPRSGAGDQAELPQRRESVVETDLLGDEAILDLKHGNT